MKLFYTEGHIIIDTSFEFTYFTLLNLNPSIANFDLLFIEINFHLGSLVLSALFVIIRDSKPMFARFPVYLTLLPLSGIIFFAVISTSYAIKDILELIMQAGAILVALLIFGVNTYLFKWKWTFLGSILAFLCAYIIPFINFNGPSNGLLLGSILLSLGMILLTFSLVKYT